MTERSRTTAGLAFLLALAITAGCGGRAAANTGGTAPAAPTTASPADSTKTICADLEAVTGLAERVARASNAQNITDVTAALTDARDHARQLTVSAPPELRPQTPAIADQLDRTTATLSAARPNATADPAVQASYESIKALYALPAMTDLAAYRTSHC